MKNLVEILNNNGTRVLKGICRPSEITCFRDLIKGKDLLTSKTRCEQTVAFSLNQHFLGKFKIRIFHIEPEKNNLQASICKGPGEGIWLKITWSDDENDRSAEFLAIMSALI